MSDAPHSTSPVTPGNDFYRFINGDWQTSNPIPDDKARSGTFTELSDHNRERIYELLQHPVEPNTQSGTAQLHQFFTTAMNEAAIEQDGLKPVQDLIQEIKNLTSPIELANFIARWHNQGMSLLWGIGIEPDDKCSTRYVVRIRQSGLSLPDREYYLDESERFLAIRRAYVAYLTQLFTLLDVPEAKSAAQSVLALETKLADNSATATELRDVEAMYNEYAVEDLPEVYKKLNWPSYFEHTGLKSLETLLVSQPQFLHTALDLISSEPLTAWQAYCLAHCLGPLLHALPETFALAYFDFYGRVLQGVSNREPRYRRVINDCAGWLPEPLGHVFVTQYFSEDAKTAIYDLVGHLKTALGIRLDQLDWMSSDTKAQAHKKLATFLPLLGYPDSWRDYSNLHLTTSYVGNLRAIAAFEWQRDVSRRGQIVDRKEWLMSPATVNAYYWPSTNGITFPAGILQPPFFDPTGDFAANYGAIGAVIGHEMCHGFDDSGSKFDAEGNLHSWWTPSDRTAFDDKTSRLVEQFDDYIVNDRHVNGKLTLGENIADLGGLLVAYDGLQAKLTELGTRDIIDGSTPEQRFFTSFAVVWRQNIRSELELIFLVTDPHAPNPLRTNGTLRNIDAWYEAFGVTAGDALYLPPDKRVRIW